MTNISIGILVYGSLYNKLCYKNNTIQDILIYNNNNKLYINGPKLPIILGRKGKYDNITRTLEYGFPERSSIIYLVKPEISLEKAYDKLALREGCNHKYIGIYDIENKIILYNYQLSNNNIINLLLYKFNNHNYTNKLKYILFVYFPYNLDYNININNNLYINEYYFYLYLKKIKNKTIIDNILIYLNKCDPNTLSLYDKLIKYN